MKSLQELINEKIVFETFEDYCNYHNINSPDISNEHKFFTWNYFGFANYDDYIINIYERLGESLSPDFIYNKLVNNFKNLKNFAVISHRNENIVLKFKSKEGFKNNPKFISILNYCNWDIISIKPEGDDISNNLVTYSIEPKKTTNRTKFIYNDCHGIIYKIINKQKLNKILKYGLNPKKETLDTNIYRNYFIANTNKDKIHYDIIMLINDIDIFRHNRDKLCLIKIDLNKLKK